MQSGLGAITLKNKNWPVQKDVFPRGVAWKCAAGANFSAYYKVDSAPNTFFKIGAPD
jgi:hypothetical protein